MRSLTFPGLTASEKTQTMTVPVPDWNTEYRKESENANELFLTATQAPLNRPVRIRIMVRYVKDIYSGTNINTINRAIDPRGIKILTEVFAIGVEADPDHPEIPEIYLPARDQHVITIAIGSDTITADKVLKWLTESQGVLFSGTSATARISELLRHVLTPFGLA